MSAAAILAGMAVLAYGIPLALGFGDGRRTALSALFIAAPLEVYRTEAVLGNLSVFRVVLAVAVVIAVCENGAALRGLIRQPIVLAAAGLLLVIAASLLLASENTSLGLTVLGQGAVVLVAALTTALLASGLSLREVLALVCLGAVVPVLAAAAQGIFAYGGHPFDLPLVSHLPVPAGLEVTRAGTSFLGEDGVRLKATFGDPNHFAVWLTFVLAASVAVALPWWLGRQRNLALSVGIWCVGVAVVLMGTSSRSGWLSAAVAAACGATLTGLSPSARGLLSRYRKQAIAVALIGALAFVPLAPKIAQRLDSGRAANRISTDAHARTTRVALDEFKDHPLGIGVGDLGPRLQQTQRTSGAHSSYLTVAAELGLPGLLAALSLLLLVARAFARAAGSLTEDRVACLALFCAYVGFLVANAFYDLLWDDFHWMIVGVALALAVRTSGDARASSGDELGERQDRNARRAHAAGRDEVRLP